MSMQMRASRARIGQAGPAMGDPGLFSWARKAVSKLSAFVPVVGPALSSVLSQPRTRQQSTGPMSAASFRLATPGQRAGSLGLMGGQRAAFMNMPSAQQISQFGPNGAASVLQPSAGPLAALQRFVPGGATGMEGTVQPKGYHANKTSYFLQDGTHVPAGSRWVKNRRRNPFNPRALSHAMGRIVSFKSGVDVAKRITIRKKC